MLNTGGDRCRQKIEKYITNSYEYNDKYPPNYFKGFKQFPYEDCDVYDTSSDGFYVMIKNKKHHLRKSDGYPDMRYRENYNMFQ